MHGRPGGAKRCRGQHGRPSGRYETVLGAACTVCWAVRNGAGGSIHGLPGGTKRRQGAARTATLILTRALSRCMCGACPLHARSCTARTVPARCAVRAHGACTVPAPCLCPPLMEMAGLQDGRHRVCPPPHAPSGAQTHRDAPEAHATRLRRPQRASPEGRGRRTPRARSGNPPPRPGQDQGPVGILGSHETHRILEAPRARPRGARARGAGKWRRVGVCGGAGLRAGACALRDKCGRGPPPPLDLTGNH